MKLWAKIAIGLVAGICPCLIFGEKVVFLMLGLYSAKGVA